MNRPENLMKNLLILLLSAVFLMPITAKDVNTLGGKVTAEALNEQFSGVLAGKGELFIKAEKEYGIPAILLAAIAIQESGGGKSKMALRCNNVFGITPNGKTGLRFKTVEDCINYECKLLNDKYLKQGRRTVTSIGRKYCASGGWSKAVNKHISLLQRRTAVK